jgi:hypothetical protein
MTNAPHTQSLIDVLTRWQSGEITWRSACAELGTNIDELYQLAEEHGKLPKPVFRKEAVEQIDAILKRTSPGNDDE